jgi:photosystem II stability/assembly factor-like uncharacterized protein
VVTAGGPAGIPVTVIGHPAPGGTGQLEAVACPTARNCWAVGTPPAAASASGGIPAMLVLDTTTDGGISWHTLDVPVANPMELDGISCPDRSDCIAVGAINGSGQLLGGVLATSDGGRSWHSLDAPAGAVDLVGVSCATAERCMVMATDGSTYWSELTADGGRIWQRGGGLPAGFGGAGAVTCTSAVTCLVAGYTSASPGKGAGAVAFTEDAGTDWAAASVPTGIGLLHDVACGTAMTCTAVGTLATSYTDVIQGRGAILASEDGGQTWASVPSPPGVNDAFGVSCPTARRCVTVGTVWAPTNPPTPIGGVVTSRDGGTSWRTPRARYIPVGLVSVDCPVPVSCVAVGNDVAARIVLP